MRGNDKVLKDLSESLKAELTAINQYFLHAKMCENWGYRALHAHIHKESIDEMRHADKLVDRILYLEGLPNLQRLGKVNVGQNVAEQLRLDLATETSAIALLNRGVQLCRDQGDNGTRELLAELLVSEEEHANWLEAQLELIKQVGEANYLAQQIREHD